MAGLNTKTAARAAATALAIAAALAAAACKNSIDLVSEVKKTVMKANDRYLEVKSIAIPEGATGFSPTGAITIELDRKVARDSATAANIVIRLDNGADNPAVDPASVEIAFLADDTKLEVRVLPYLETGRNYILTVSNLYGIDGNRILEPITRAFSTGHIATGKVTSLTGASPDSLAGHSTTGSVRLAVKVNDAYPIVKIRVSADGGSTWPYDIPWTPRPLTGDLETPIEGLADGVRVLRVLFVGNTTDGYNAGSSGFEGDTAEATITIDSQPPTAPAGWTAARTNARRPTWTWSPSGGGDGHFRSQLGSELGAWTALTEPTFAPATDLADGAYTLYVQERDAAGNWSASAAFALTVDTDPPARPTLSGTALADTKTPAWSWVAGLNEDGSGLFRYQLDGEAAAWSETGATSLTAPELADGTHTLFVQERDSAGNWSASASFATTVDTTAPNAPTVQGSSLTNDPTPIWVWSSGGGGGAGAYRYRIDGGTWATTSGTFFTPASDLAEGAHVFEVQERDELAHWSASGSFATTISFATAGAPAVSCADITSVAIVTWTWATGGEGGNGTYQYRLDQGTWGAATTATSYTSGTALADGIHVLYVQERNDAGNWSAEGSASVVVDTAKPGTPSVAGATPTNDTTPEWTWTGGGGGNGVYRVQLDGTAGAWTEVVASAWSPATALAEGSHSLYVKERDTAGNWSDPGSFAVTVDTTAPPAPDVLSASALTNDTTPTWTWKNGGTGGDGTYRYALDAAPGASSPVTTSLAYTPTSIQAEGFHTLYVQERDAAGNWSASGSYQLKIDITPPSAPSVSGAALTNVQTPTWTWVTGGGGVGAWSYQLDSTSGAWIETATAGFTPATALSEGPHTLHVMERDAAGNWSEPGSFAITIDVTAPATPIFQSASCTPSPTKNTTPTWVWESGGGGDGTFRYKFDAANDWTVVTTKTFTPVTALADGNHTLAVQERDAALNWTPSSATRTIVVDTTPPAAPTFTAPAAGDRTPTWSWTLGYGASRVEFYLYCTTTGKYLPDTGSSTVVSQDSSQLSYTYTTALPDGTYELRMWELDAAGNWTWAVSSFTLDAAPNAPTVDITQEIDDSGYGVVDNATWTFSPNGFGAGTYRLAVYSNIAARKYYNFATSTWSGATTPLWKEGLSSATYTTALGFSFGETLTAYMQEVDADGDYSTSGSKTYTIGKVYPAEGATGAARKPVLYWAALSVAHGSTATYTVYRKSGVSWIVWDGASALTAASFTTSTILSSNTQYYWKVIRYTNGTLTDEWPSSAGASFTTGIK